MYSGATDGIYKTSDTGQTWRRTMPLLFSTQLAIDPANTLFVYAYGRGQFLASSDGGETWRQSSHALGDTAIDLGYSYTYNAPLIWVDPAGSGVVAVGFSLSRDHGNTWTALTVPDSGWASFLIPDPHHSGVLYASFSGGTLGTFWLSQDWGATWTSEPAATVAGFPTFNAMFNLLFDPDIPGRRYAIVLSWIDISDDNGATWRTSQTGNVDGGTWPAVLPKYCSGGAFATVNGGMVAVSRDAAATFGNPQLNRVMNLAAGPGCSLFAVRQLDSDAFVAKLAPGGEVIWSTFLGGAGADAASAIALDQYGNVLVSGTTSAPDFPVTASTIGTRTGTDGFVVKYDSDGKVLYSTVIAAAHASNIAAGTAGEAYFTGYPASNAPFPATPGAYKTAPGGNDGVIVALAPDGSLVFASYLPGLAPNRFSQYGPTPPPPAVAVAVEDSGGILIGGDTGGLLRMSPDGSSVTSAAGLTGRIYSIVRDAAGNAYVAAEAPSGGSKSCFAGYYYHVPAYYPAGDILLYKLENQSLRQLYLARTFGQCESYPGALAVSPNGEVTLSVISGGIPLVNPLVISTFTAGVIRFSADGSTLVFSSLLASNSPPPPVALSPDGSAIYVASGGIPTAAVLRITVPGITGPTIHDITDSITGTRAAPAPGQLITITGANLATDFVDLGLNYSSALPTQLGGVQVLLNGAPTSLLQVAPDHVIFVAPLSVNQQDWASLTVRNGSMSTPSFFTPTSYPGGMLFLTNSFPSAPSPDPDGNIRNADGTLNDANHPATPGSLVQLFAVGLAGPGPVQLYWDAPHYTRTPTNPFPPAIYPLTGIARSLPGFIPELYAIDFRIPDAAGQGVYTVPTSGLLTRVQIWWSNSIGIYVK